MEKFNYYHKMLFGGVLAFAAAGVTWRCCARRPRDPRDPPAAADGDASPTAAGGGDASPTAAGGGKSSSAPASPSARAQRREAAGPCPRPRPPAAGAAAEAADPGAASAAPLGSPATPRDALPATPSATTQERAPADTPARSGSVCEAPEAGAAATAPAAASQCGSGDVPPPGDAAPAAASALPAPSARAWRPKGSHRAELCPDDYISDQQRLEEKQAADDVVLVSPPARLYLSSYLGTGAKSKLQAGGVTRVLCLDSELRAKHPGDFVYKVLDLQDDMYQDILSRVPEAFSFIQQGGCLVHCEVGRSRSATIVLAWLMLRGKQDLRSAWDQLSAVRPQICPNRFFKRQLMRLGHMTQAGDHFHDHPLYAFHQAECEIIDKKSASVVQNTFDLSVDPAEYSEEDRCGGGGALPGLVCSKCRRVVCSPLNLFWLGGALWNAPATGPAGGCEDALPVPAAITEVAHGAVAAVGEVRCPGCGTVTGSLRYCTAAVADANAREPCSGAWQHAAGALAAGAPAALLPQWCAALHCGTTRLATMVPRGAQPRRLA